MVQKDYVSLTSLGCYRKKRHHQKNKNWYKLEKVLILSVILLITLFWTIYFMHRDKSEKLPLLKYPNMIKVLPPIPEERWRYIKELEHHQCNISKPIEPTAKGGVQLSTQIMNEKQKINGKTVLDLDKKTTQTLKIQSTKLKNKKERISYWVLQCGSFRTLEPAELLRANLALSGIESSIISMDGWNRVIVGHSTTRTRINDILQHLKSIQVSNCIPRHLGGLKISLNPPI